MSEGAVVTLLIIAGTTLPFAAAFGIPYFYGVGQSRGRCTAQHLATGRCEGLRSRLCMDFLCVRCCQTFHKDGCGR